MRVFVRQLSSVDECEQVEKLQQAVWSDSDLEVVPLHMLLTASANGGYLAGAFEGSGGAVNDGPAADRRSAEGRPQAPRLLGFIFSFLGMETHTHSARSLKHCSHMLAVLPEYRDQGVGFLLKRAQRDFVLAQGMDLVTWTFDPLESRNGHLNLHRLGAIARRYREDLYGAMRDRLNRGLPSDRFEVEWWLASPRVTQRIQGAPAPAARPASVVNRVVPHKGFAAPEGWSMPTGRETVAVEIPADFQTLRSEEPELASMWRAHVREVFEDLFAAGWVAVDHWSPAGEAHARSFYVLEPAEHLPEDLPPEGGGHASRAR